MAATKTASFFTKFLKHKTIRTQRMASGSFSYFSISTNTQ